MSDVFWVECSADGLMDLLEGLHSLRCCCGGSMICQEIPLHAATDTYMQLVPTVTNWTQTQPCWSMGYGNEHVFVCVYVYLEQRQLILVSCLISFIIRLTAEYRGSLFSFSLLSPLFVFLLCVSHGKYLEQCPISIYLLPYSDMPYMKCKRRPNRSTLSSCSTVSDSSHIHRALSIQYTPHTVPYEFVMVTLTSSCSDACLIVGMTVSVIW